VKLSPVARYSLAAVAFLTPAVWLAMLLGCVKYGNVWPQTCEPVNFAAAPLAVGAGVAGVMGVIYMRRAHRRATKGMWRRVSLGGWKSFEHRLETVKALAWGSEDEAPGLITGEGRFERRRWLVPVKNGQRVWVDRAEFWVWLRDQVEPLAATLPPGHSAIASRLWKKKLGEGKYLAYCAILEATKRCEWPTGEARSRRYVSRGGAVWSVVEEFEKIMKSEVY
jgi:hypothetical protein